MSFVTQVSIMILNDSIYGSLLDYLYILFLTKVVNTFKTVFKLKKSNLVLLGFGMIIPEAGIY